MANKPTNSNECNPQRVSIVGVGCYSYVMDEDFGERLRRLRTERHMTQQEVADRAGRSRPWVTQLESGARWRGKLPPGDDLRAVATALGLTLDELTGEVPAPPLPRLAEVRAAYDTETATLAEIGRSVVQMVNERGNLLPGPRVRQSAAVRRVPIVNGLSASELADGVRQVEQSIELPAALLNGARDPVAYIVDGDCLWDRWGIKTGDTLIVDAANTAPRDGQIVAARINDADETAKKFYRVPGGVDLRPTSAGYNTIEVRDPDQLRIIGVYVTHLVTGKR